MPVCLIVDDDRDGREGFAEYLRAFGFDIEECANGAAGWEAIQARPPDIVLLDLQLPQLSGWDLLTRLRATPRFKQLPIIAFSACVFPEDRNRAAQAGCNVFLPKPSAPADVLAELRNLLRLQHSPGHDLGTTDA